MSRLEPHHAILLLLLAAAVTIGATLYREYKYPCVQWDTESYTKRTCRTLAKGTKHCTERPATRQVCAQRTTREEQEAAERRRQRREKNE